MATITLTREEALRRWNRSKQIKQEAIARLKEGLRQDCLKRTGKKFINK